MNYNEINNEIFEDFLKYKKKIFIKIGDKTIILTEEFYSLFLKKIKEGLCNWLDSTRFMFDKGQYLKLMNNLLKWTKN